VAGLVVQQAEEFSGLRLGDIDKTLRQIYLRLIKQWNLGRSLDHCLFRLIPSIIELVFIAYTLCQASPAKCHNQ
jgi:hypothetical protein